MRKLFFMFSTLGFVGLAACGGDPAPAKSADDAAASERAAERAEDKADDAAKKADEAADKANDASK